MFRTLCTALFLILALVACHQEGAPQPPKVAPPVKKGSQKAPAKKKDEPDTEFKNLHYVIYEKGRLKWDIYAAEAYIFKGNKIKLKKLNVCANREKGFCISSEKGVYDPQAGRFTFYGNVVLNAGKKGKLYTSVLKYLPKQEALETEAPVTIENEGLFIKGRGFFYDVKTGTMKVLKRTKVRVNA